MARIDWAVVCESAFFDRDDRLCLIGISRTLSVATLPCTLRQATLVARLTDIAPVDEVAVVVGMVSPSGYHGARPGTGHVAINMAGEYVLASLRDIPLMEPGIHRFQVKLRGQPAVTVDVPVWPTDPSVSVHAQ